MLALAIWVVGQDLGQLYSGHATDPNTAPIIALMAIAILVGRRARVDARVSVRAVRKTGRVAHALQDNNF